MFIFFNLSHIKANSILSFLKPVFDFKKTTKTKSCREPKRKKGLKDMDKSVVISRNVVEGD